MKKRANWLLIPAVALGLGACKEKKTAQTPDAPNNVVETVKKAVAQVIPETTIPKASTEERAAKLGFAKYLPQDTEIVFALHNGTKNIDRIKASKFWKMIEKEISGNNTISEEGIEAEIGVAEAVMDPAVAEIEDEPVADEPAVVADESMGPAALFSEEFTLALGKTSGEQLGHLLTLNRRSTYFQMRTIAKAFAEAVKSGNIDQATQSFASSFGTEMIKDLANDPKSGVGLIEKLTMPPIYMAFKTKEKDREAAAQQVSGMMSSIGMLGEMVEPVSIEKMGSKFEGYKILGEKVSETLAGSREMLQDQLDAASIDRLIATLAKKDLVMVSGILGDHVVVFIGGSIDDLKLASDAGSSILASDAFAFADPYLAKDLAALVYGEKKSLETIYSNSGGLADVTDGFRDGLAGSDGLGDTRDLEALFKIVGEREAALRQLAVNDAFGAVAFLEDGMKIELHGGYDSGMTDWKKPNQLAHLGKAEGVALFANFNFDAAFDQKAGDYYEALWETVYAIAAKVAESPIESAELTQFKEGFKLFDGKFRPEVTALWEAFSKDFRSSLGQEKAWIIDLKGAAPAVPGIPQKVVDEAKIPRVSMICPVTDRTKLAASWDKMNLNLTSSLAKMSEISGNNIPMQKPMSTEKNGNATWFFPMPLFNDDFLPSVTVSDKWFVASSSKNQALDLIDKATTGGENGSGLSISVDFKVLEKYSKDIYKIVDENAEAMRGEALSTEDKKNISRVLSVMATLDKFSLQGRRENSVMRTSFHFKVK